MTNLSYKNFVSKQVLSYLRDIRYAQGRMLFGFNNTVELSTELRIDVKQLSNQADVFARQMLTFRALFDLKRFLGQYQIDWLRILHEAYVYDRIKCIYYGINSNNLFEVPNDLYSFPGNILLMNALSKVSFTYESGDQQPFSFYGKVKYNTNAEELFKEVFEAYPELKEGMSDDKNIISYVNSRCESVLKGLYYGKEYLESSSKRKSAPFEIFVMNDETIKQIILSNNTNPIFNSFLNETGLLFYFYMPVEFSKPNGMRFNESIFLARALGFISKQLDVDGNSFFSQAERNTRVDIFTRDEVYSVTALKSEIIPYSPDQIKEYLGINSYKNGENGGVSNNKDDIPLSE